MKRIRLDDIEKKVPFEVPEDYFDQLTSQIQERIQEKPKRVWIPQGQVRWALAGAFVIVLAALIVFYPNTSNPSAEQLLAEVSDEDLIEYLDLGGISESDLLEGLNTESLENLWDDDALQDLDLDDSELDDLLVDYELDNLL